MSSSSDSNSRNSAYLVIVVGRNRARRFPQRSTKTAGEIRADGALTHWHSPVLTSFGRDQGPPMFVMEGAVTSAVYQAIAVAAWLYEQARSTDRSILASLS